MITRDNNSSADVEARVKAFIADETAMRFERLSLSTRLVEDIGIDGDDAIELFERFAKEFDVDLTAMQWRSHFSDEGMGCPLGCVFAVLFGWSYTLAQRWFVPITVGDLVEAAKAKRWVKKYASSARQLP